VGNKRELLGVDKLETDALAYDIKSQEQLVKPYTQPKQAFRQAAMGFQ
jgi:hypothetical protein